MSKLVTTLKKVFIGEGKNLKDTSMFHKLTLVAFLLGLV